jgi:hypothetical protein
MSSMQKAPDSDSLWKRGIEAISESRDLVAERQAYLDQAFELAVQRLSSANASMIFARRAAHALQRTSHMAVTEEKSRGPQPANE